MRKINQHISLNSGQAHYAEREYAEQVYVEQAYAEQEYLASTTFDHEVQGGSGRTLEYNAFDQPMESGRAIHCCLDLSAEELQLILIDFIRLTMSKYRQTDSSGQL